MKTNTENQDFRKMEAFMRWILSKAENELKNQFHMKSLINHIYKPKIKKEKLIKLPIDFPGLLSKKEDVEYSPRKFFNLKLENYFIHFEIDQEDINFILENPIDSVLPYNIKNLIQKIVSGMNAQIYNLYKKVSQSFRINPSLWFKDLSFLHDSLTKNKAFSQDRFLIMNNELLSFLLGNYSIYQEIYNTKNNNSMNYLGSFFGFHHYHDIELPFHKAGTLGSSTAELTKDLSPGTDSITLYNLEEKAHVHKGDLFRFSSLKDQENKDLKQESYLILEDARADQNGIMEIHFQKPIQEKIEKGRSIILEKSHFVNLAFQRQAFVSMARGVDDLSEHIQPKAEKQDYKELELSLRIDTRQGYDNNIFELDIVYGADLIYPDFVFRVLN